MFVEQYLKITNQKGPPNYKQIFVSFFLIWRFTNVCLLPFENYKIQQTITFNSPLHIPDLILKIYAFMPFL